MNRNQASAILLLGLGAIILGLGWSGRLSAAWTALTQGPSAVPPLTPLSPASPEWEPPQTINGPGISCYPGYVAVTNGTESRCIDETTADQWLRDNPGWAYLQWAEPQAAGQAQHITYLPTGAWDIRPAPNGTL